MENRYNASNNYTVPIDGWVLLRPATGGKIYINGAEVGRSPDNTQTPVIVPVKTGDVITGSDARSTMYLWPNR